MAWLGKHKVLWLAAVLLLWAAPRWAWAGKAVVVVGPIDPPLNERTQAYIAEAEQVAQIIEQAGYQVTRLYHPQATWTNLLMASQGCEIFVYYGHGNGYGWQGLTDDSSTSGLCLTDAENPDLIQAGPGVPGGSASELQDLELASGCLVALIHTCYAAGSSRLDREAVDYPLARQRVRDYAEAFFQAGAGYYLATTFAGVAPKYFRYWLSGKSLRRAFREVLGGQRTYAGDGMLLVEDYEGTDDPYPWVSALVVNHEQRLAAAAPEEAPAQERQPTAEQQQTARLGDDGGRRAVSATVVQPHQAQQRPKWQAVMSNNGGKHRERLSERNRREQSVFLGRLDGGSDQRGDALGFGLFGHELGQQWWSLYDLLPFYWREVGGEWVAAGVFEHWSAVRQSEDLAVLLEIIPAAVDAAGASYPVNRPPA